MSSQASTIRPISALTSLFNVCFLVSIVFLSGPLNANTSAALAIESISRPSTADLTRIIQTSDSVVSTKTQHTIAEYLREMDKNHLRFLEANKLKVIQNEDAFSEIAQTALPIPQRTPLCEKTVTYFMFLQIDMLDHVLTQQDDASAISLRRQRSTVRLLRPEQRVFGDSRDLVVAAIVKALSDINALHIALNVRSDLEISYPTRIKTLEEIEQYILVKAAAVLYNAQQLANRE